MLGNVQISLTLQGGGDLLKPSECRHMGEGDLAKSSYNFYSGWKSLIHSFSCSIFGVCGGIELVENVIWGRGLKLLKKPSYDIWTFP